MLNGRPRGDVAAMPDGSTVMSQEYVHVLDYVDGYLHGALHGPEAAYVEQHCESCRICKVALEEARKRFAALETLPACEASEQLVQATLKNIDVREQKRKRLRKRLFWGIVPAAAAAALIIGAFHLYYLNLKPTPYDLQVLGQSTFLEDSLASLRVRLIDRNTGAPLAGVPVTIELQRTVTEGKALLSYSTPLANFTTDALGTGQPGFRLPLWAEGNYKLRVSATPAEQTETVSREIQIRRSWKLMLSSDKPVYQPGQDIHVRALTLRRPDLKPVAGHEMVFTIADPKGNIIFKRQGVTSKFGIASIDCPLATEIIEGPYTIACKVGDTESKRTVEVKKYVLPKFKVAVELDQPYYQPGQKVKGAVHADYFFGKPVAGGSAEIELKPIDVSQGEPSDKKGEPPDLFRRVTTDQTGKASFEFVLPKSLVGREQDSGDARFTLQVTVTDTAGQKQTKTESRVVTHNPIKIEVIPEAGPLA